MMGTAINAAESPSPMPAPIALPTSGRRRSVLRHLLQVDSAVADVNPVVVPPHLRLVVDDEALLLLAHPSSNPRASAVVAIDVGVGLGGRVAAAHGRCNGDRVGRDRCHAVAAGGRHDEAEDEQVAEHAESYRTEVVRDHRGM